MNIRGGLVSWNPRRWPRLGRLASRIPLGKHVNNFGDLLGPFIVSEICERYGLNWSRGPDKRLLTVGSIMHLAHTDDVVWGAGVNGKQAAKYYKFADLDVRAVRGPMTRRFLADRNIAVPEVYGDPALLLSEFYTRPELAAGYAKTPLTIVPNLNEVDLWDPADGRVLRPTESLMNCLGRIAASSFVVGSSLHGVIVAESLGIPARLLNPSAESMFKYEDYYLGSGRQGVRAAANLNDAINMGGVEPPIWDANALIGSFPCDLFTPSVSRARF